jgi:hypothetical protein
MTRRMRRVGKVWIRIFPDVPVSTKPAEVRMGKGKGSPEYWVVRVKPGRILFEMDGVPEVVAREAMALAAAKLPIAVKFVTKPVYLADGSIDGAAGEDEGALAPMLDDSDDEDIDTAAMAGSE